MGKLFDMNNKFFQFMAKMADVIFLNLLWFIASLPIFTIGASTTAVYYTAVKVIRNDTSHLGKEFWHALRDNFKLGTVLWGLSVLLMGVLILDLVIVHSLLQNSFLKFVLLAALIVMLIMMLVLMQYCFSYLSRFQDSFKTVVRNSLYLMLGNLKSSLLILAVLIGSIILLLSSYGLLFIFLLPTAGVVVSSNVFEKLYKTYLNINTEQ